MKKAPAGVLEARPSSRQLKWQQTEFYGLISYGLPVFTGKQYGEGFTPPSVFCPETMDTDYWCDIAVKAGMKALVITAKHYDGFCLWQTRMTDYSVRSSNWLGGEGDLVAMLASSCKKFGLKFGIYLAPWDRHEKTYGTGKPYDDFFCGLLTELLTAYPDVFCVWLDGSIDADEKRVQNYDWGRYYKLIRKLAPDAVISFRGPDVRWAGNEKGYLRESEWSPLPAYLGVYEDGTEAKPNKKPVSLNDPKLGSLNTVKGETEFIWYPCELSVPMRPKWFWESDEGFTAKTKDKLLKLYYGSVGNNSCFMLGLSPDKRGSFGDTDEQILISLGSDLELQFGNNLLHSGCKISSSGEYSSKTKAGNITNDDMSLFWRPADKDRKPELTIELNKEEYFDKIVLAENIAGGQHIEEFKIFINGAKGKWEKAFEGTTVGYKRICPISAVKASKVKIVFTSFREYFELSSVLIN